MSHMWIITIIISLLTETVLASHNTTGQTAWNEVYKAYVCDTADGYLWLADACTFPVKQAIDYFLKFGDTAEVLYDADDYSFNGRDLYTLTTDNTTIDTNLYDWDTIFPYSEEKICGEYMEVSEECMLHYFRDCQNDLEADITTFMNDYKNQFCSGSELHQYVQNQRGVFGDFVTGNTRRAQCQGLQELYDDVIDGTTCTEDVVFESPYVDSNDNITTFVESSPDDFYDIQTQYSVALMSAMRCVEIEMRRLGCPTSEAESLVVYLYSQIVPPGVTVDLTDVAAVFVKPEETDTLITGNEADQERATCGTFGQGHVMQYGRLDNDDRQVCRLREQWTQILMNKFVEISGLPKRETNDGYRSMYFEAIEITVFDGSGQTLMEYSLSDGQLTQDVTIVDEKTQVLDEPSNAYLSLEPLTDNTMLLTNPLGDVAIMIMRYNSIYGLWVRMYEDDFDRSYGLLVDGCPGYEVNQVDVLGYDPTSSRRRRRRDVSNACSNACEDVDTAEYVASCEYDCTVNGGDTSAAVGVNQMSAESYTETGTADSFMLTDYSRSKAPESRVSISMLSFLIFLVGLLSKR